MHERLVWLEILKIAFPKYYLMAKFEKEHLM